MNRERIKNWFQESLAMMGVLNQVSQNVNQLKAHRNMAEAAGHGNNLLEAEKKLNEVGRAYEAMSKAVFTRLFVADFDTAQQQLVDMESKMEIMEKAFQEWRSKKAEFEFILATTGFAPEPEEEDAGVLTEEAARIGMRPATRRQAEERLTVLRAHYEAALKLLDELIPNRPVLVHV